MRKYTGKQMAEHFNSWDDDKRLSIEFDDGIRVVDDEGRVFDRHSDVIAGLLQEIF